MRICFGSYSQTAKDAGLCLKINESNCNNLFRKEDNFLFKPICATANLSAAKNQGQLGIDIPEAVIL